MPYRARSTDPSQTYLVMVREQIVCRDLCDTIRDHEPGAGVIAAATLAGAIDAVRPLSRLSVAFVEAGPASLCRSCLTDLIRDRGGRLVLFGDDAEDEWEAAGMPPGRWTILFRPFFAQTVLALLVGVPAGGTGP